MYKTIETVDQLLEKEEMLKLLELNVKKKTSLFKKSAK